MFKTQLYICGLNVQHMLSPILYEVPEWFLPVVDTLCISFITDTAFLVLYIFYCRKRIQVLGGYLQNCKAVGGVLQKYLLKECTFSMTDQFKFG
jgi:hypothetical protein